MTNIVDAGALSINGMLRVACAPNFNKWANVGKRPASAHGLMRSNVAPSIPITSVREIHHWLIRKHCPPSLPVGLLGISAAKFKHARNFEIGNLPRQNSTSPYFGCTAVVAQLPP